MDAILAVGIDPSGAEQGSRVFKRSLEDIEQSASKGMSAVDRMNQSLNGSGNAFELYRRQTESLAAQMKALDAAAQSSARIVNELALKFEVVRQAAKDAVSTLQEFGRTKFTGDITAQMNRLADDMARAMDEGGKGAVAAARASQKEILSLAKTSLDQQLDLVRQEAQKRIAGAQEELQRIKDLHKGSKTEIAALERSAAQQALEDAKAAAKADVATAKAANAAVLADLQERTNTIITLKQRENAVQAEYERGHSALVKTENQLDGALTRLLATEKAHADQIAADIQESERLLTVVRRGIQARDANTASITGSTTAITAETAALREQASVAQQTGRYSVSNSGLLSASLPAPPPRVKTTDTSGTEQERADVIALADELDKLVLRYDFASAATARRTEALETLLAAQRAGIFENDQEVEHLRKLFTGEQQHADALTALKAQYNGLSQAEQRYATELARATRILDDANANETDRAAILHEVAQAYDPAIAAAEKAAAENDRLAASYKSVMGSVDPAVAAQQKYESALASVVAYLTRIGSSTEAMATDMDRVRESLHPAAIEAKKLADENTKLADSYDRIMGTVDPALAAQQRYEKALADLRAGAAAAGRSAEELAQDEARLAAVMSPTAVAAKKEEDALRALVTGLDRTWGAADKLAEQQKLLDKALFDGVGGIKLSAEQHAALSKALQDQHELATRSTTSTKLAAHEAMNLSYQIQDVFVSLASGQNPLMVLIQQGPQAAMAVGGLERAMAMLLSPAGLVVAAVLAVVAGVVLLVAAMESYRSSINAVNDANKIMGDSTGLSRDRLEALAESMNKVSTRDARQMETAFIRAGNVIGQQFTDAMAITRDFARATGQELPEAAATLADILKDPAKGAEALRDSYHALTAAQTEYVQRQAAQGETSKAQQVQLDALKAKYKDFADEGVGYVERSYRFLKNAASDAWDAMGKIGVPKSVEQQLADAQKVVDGIEANFRKTMGRSPVGNELRQIEPEAYETRDKLSTRKSADDAVAGFRAQTAAAEARRSAGLSLSKQMDTEVGQLNALNDQYAALTRSSDTYAQQINDLSQGEGRASAQLEQVRAAYAQVAEATDRAKSAKDSYLTATQRLVQQDQIANTYANQYGQIAERNRARDQAILDTAGQKITAGERLQKINSAVTQVVAQQTGAVTAQVAAFDSNIASINKLAAAYGANSAAVRDAELQQKIAQATLGMAPDLANRVADGLTQQEQAQRRLNAAQADFNLRTQAEDANRLATAWGRGANAAREAALANEALGEARKRGLDPTRDAGEIQGIGQGVWARDQAQRTQQFAQMAAEQKRAAEMANAEFDMLGASNAERAKTVAILQASNDLRDKGADLTDAGTKAYIAQAGELARVQSILQETAQTASDITKPIATGLEDVIVGAKGAGDAVKALGEDLKRIAARVLITKPFETAVSGALTRLMSSGVSVANDNRPAPANDPGGLDRLITTVKGGLGSSAENAMWVRMSSGSAAFDVGAMMSSSPLPVAIQDGGSIVEAIRSEARAQGVPEDVALTIARLESNFQQFRADGSVLRSSAGAMGVMQLMPDTAKWLGVDASDTRENVRGGIKYLAMLGRQFGGDWSQVAGAYNAGPGRMTQYLQQGRALPAEAVSYIEKFGSSVKTASAAMVDLRGPVVGVTAAQEQQLQRQLDAVPVQRAATDSAQTLTTAQQSLIDSVLGTAKANASGAQTVSVAQQSLAASALDAGKANTGAATVIDVQSRAISTLGANAISVAEQMDDAGDATKGLAKASEDSSGILLSGARAVYNGFSSVVGSLWNTVSGLFSSGTVTGGAAGAAQTAQAGNPLGSLSQIGQIASAGQSAYTAFTGGYATMGTNAATWLANSQLGVSMGWSTAQPVVGAMGPQLPYAITTSGQAMVGTAGQMAAGLPFGAIGGVGGGIIGTATNSKVIGGLSGAAIGAGSALGYEAIMGAGAAGGPWGMAAAAVVAAVMAVLGTQKKSVGPNEAANLYVDAKGAKSGPSAGDNGADGSILKAITDATATSVNAIVSSIGSTFKKGLGEQNLAHLTYFQEGNKWALQSMAGGATVGEKQTFDTQEELVQALIRQTLQRLDQGGQVTGFSADVRTALANSKATKPEDLASDVTFASGFRDQLALLNASMDPTNNQIKAFTENAKKIGEAVKGSILDWHDKALELGLATEGELVPALKKGLLAMMGLGPAAQPLLGMAAVTKQATIEFEQYKPALLSLGYSTAEVAGLAIQYTEKAEKAYRDSVAYTKRQGSVAIEALADPTVKATASDRLQGLGLDPKNSAIAGLAGVIGNVEAAAKASTLTLTDERWALGQLNAQYDAGQLSAEQYTTAVGYLTAAWDDSAKAAQKAAALAQGREDLTDRALRGQGLTNQADDYERGLKNAREVAQAVADGYSTADIAAIRYVQWLENVAVATERATKAQQAAEDLTVRAMRAIGNTDGADDYAQALADQRAIAQAVADGMGDAYIAGLRWVQGIEAVTRAQEKAARADNARADIFTRAVSASGNSVWAATLRFDLDANKQRGDAWNSGLRGQDLTNLDAVLAAERGETVFKAAQQSVLNWYDREISAKQDLVTSIQDGALKIAQAAKQFKAAADGIRLSEDAPISPQERLAEARRQWDAALGTINSTTASESDKDSARSALSSLGQTLVSIEKTNSAGTADALYKEVLKTLDGLGDLSALGDGVATAEADLKVAQDSLKELQKGRAEAANYGQRTAGGIESLNATMVAANDNWQKAINGLSSVLAPGNTGTGGGVVAPDKGGTSAAKEAGQWMTNWFAQYDSYTAKNNASQLSQDEWQKQGAALFQDKVNKANALPLDPTVWNAFVAAAAAGSDDGRTAAWLKQVAHDKGVPGFATGTLATPPGAVWVGERGPELLWQAGGAAVASSADSLRIAGLYDAAANDRWAATNVSSFRPPALARPVASDNTTAIVAELRRLNAQIVELKKSLHDEEGSAQNQRGVLLTKLIRAVEDLKAELADLKPARAA